MTEFYELNPENLEFIDNLVGRWQKVVVAFLAYGADRKVDASGFGSGVIVNVDSIPYLITAKHVVDDALNKYKCSSIVVNGTNILLEHVAFATDEKRDLAVARLDYVLARNGIDRYTSVPLIDEQLGYNKLPYQLVMGFPANKNKLKTRYGKSTPELLSITAEKFDGTIETPSPIVDPFYIKFSDKKQIDTYNNRIGVAPKLKGMSGGPIMGLLVKPTGLNQYHFSMECVGILVEGYPKQKCLVGSHIKAILDLCNQFVR
ncbi:S1 family peptidase [Vibrio harveyi]|nr:serine protease [Vibrio harveyi]CAK6716514.1 Putative Trypsin-like serine protease [Vibrio harveyi]